MIIFAGIVSSLPYQFTASFMTLVDLLLIQRQYLLDY